MYAKAEVNVRDLPSTEGEKVGRLSAWEKVTVTGQCKETNWYRIIYEGKEAYVTGNYLVDNKPTPTPTTPYFVTDDNNKTEIIFNEEYVYESTVTVKNYIMSPLEAGVPYFDVQIVVSNPEVVFVDEGLSSFRWGCEMKYMPLQNGECDITYIACYENWETSEILEILDTYVVHVTVDLPPEEPVISEPLPEYDPIANGYPFKVDEWQCGDNITATLWANYDEWSDDDYDEVLVITGFGEMWDSMQYSDHFEHNMATTCNNVSQIYIGEGITRIGSLDTWATFVQLPSTAKVIGARAFVHTNKLVTINLPEGLEIIEEGAFSNCNKMEMPILPSTLKYIGGSSFGGGWINDPWEGKILDIPESVIYIDVLAFFMRDNFTLRVHGDNYKNFGYIPGDSSWNCHYSLSDMIDTIYVD